MKPRSSSAVGLGRMRMGQSFFRTETGGGPQLFHVLLRKTLVVLLGARFLSVSSWRVEIARPPFSKMVLRKGMMFGNPCDNVSICKKCWQCGFGLGRTGRDNPSF